ncbi:MAG: hypothetical protein ACI9YT_001145 [Halobacteriales archaeon]|jgi:hypothetical protein
MVGPSLSDGEREEWVRTLQTAFVLLVGFSGGLVALSGDASVALVGASVLGGLVVGVVLVWHISTNVPW